MGKAHGTCSWVRIRSNIGISSAKCSSAKDFVTFHLKFLNILLKKVNTIGVNGSDHLKNLLLYIHKYAIWIALFFSEETIYFNKQNEKKTSYFINYILYVTNYKQINKTHALTLRT